jgi:hypothetical protein
MEEEKVSLEQAASEEGKIMSPEIPRVTKQRVILLEPKFWETLVKYLGSRPSQEAGHLFIDLARATPQEITITQ